MRDAAADEYQPLGNDVRANHSAGDAGEKTSQERVPKERVFKQFRDIHQLPAIRRAFSALSTH